MEEGRVKKPTNALKWLAAYKYVLLAVLLGVLLLLLPDEKAASVEKKTAQPMDFDRVGVQREMEEILSAIDGVGQLRLMLTVRGGGELELAQDRALTQKRTESEDEYSDKTETVLLGNGAEVVVTQSRYPDFVGALVVCEGGGSASVRLEITQALCALTGLPSDRISVIKGKP